MNLRETAGGSSQNESENGDASNESERPLKKARFAWQVKGKYHLKNDTNDTTITSAPISPEPEAAETSGSGSANHNRGAEQNLEMLGDYFKKQEFNALDSLIATPGQSLPMASASTSNEIPSYPRYVSSHQQNTSNRGPLNDFTTRSNFPQPWVSQVKFTEEECLAQWQTKQLLQCFVDNSINRVLDTWMQTPEEEPTRTLVQEIAEFINNFPGVNSIEDEGILMAIAAHGLQQPATASSSARNNMNNNVPHRRNLLPNMTSAVPHGGNVLPNMNSNFPNIGNAMPNMSNNFRLVNPLASDNEYHEQENNTIPLDSDSSSNDSDLTWFYTDSQKYGDSAITPFPLFPESSSLSYQNVDDSRQNSIVECDANDDNIDENCAFLDEAILFAIQSKGLTTIGSDYG